MLPALRRPSIFNVRAGAVNNKLWFAIREGSWQSATMGAFERWFGGRRDSRPCGWMRGAQRLQVKAGDEVARMPFTEKMPPVAAVTNHYNFCNASGVTQPNWVS